MASRTDLFVSPDYFQLDELLTEEQKLIRESVRNYVKKEISPIIEDYAQRAEFPQQIVKQLGELGCFGPTIPVEYGGGGLDYISYGLMMQELERGDSGVRSTASVQGSLVMFPIHAYPQKSGRVPAVVQPALPSVFPSPFVRFLISIFRFPSFFPRDPADFYKQDPPGNKSAPGQVPVRNKAMHHSRI